MSTSPQTPASVRQAWNTPCLVRLGTIADVAGTGTVLNQDPGNAKS